MDKNQRIEANLEAIKKTFKQCDLEAVKDQQLCIVCHEIGSGTHEGFVFCSPDCEEKYKQTKLQAIEENSEFERKVNEVLSDPRFQGTEQEAREVVRTVEKQNS